MFFGEQWTVFIITILNNAQCHGRRGATPGSKKVRGHHVFCGVCMELLWEESLSLTLCPFVGDGRVVRKE